MGRKARSLSWSRSSSSRSSYRNPSSARSETQDNTVHTVDESDLALNDMSIDAITTIDITDAENMLRSATQHYKEKEKKTACTESTVQNGANIEVPLGRELKDDISLGSNDIVHARSTHRTLPECVDVRNETGRSTDSSDGGGVTMREVIDHPQKPQLSGIKKLPVASTHELVITSPYETHATAVFGAILLLFVTLEIVFMYLCFQVTPTAPIVHAKTARKRLLAAYNTLMNSSNSTLAERVVMVKELKAAGAYFNTEVATAKEEGWQIFIYECIFYSFSWAVVACVIAIVIKYRDHKAVKSRGRAYLFQALTGLTGGLFSGFFLSATFCLVFSNFPDATDIRNTDTLLQMNTQLTNILHALILIGFLFVCMYSSAALQRQRIIYLIFTKTLETRSLKFITVPFVILNVVVYAVTVTTYSLWRAKSDFEPDDTAWGVSSCYFLILTYASIFCFYSWKTRGAHHQFSDYNANVRFIILNMSVLFILFIYKSIHPYSVVAESIGISSASRLVITVYVIDTMVSQVLKHYYGPDNPLTVRSVSV